MIVNINQFSALWNVARTQRHVIDSESPIDVRMHPEFPLRKASLGPSRTKHTLLLFTNKLHVALVEFLGQRVMCTELVSEKLKTVDINSDTYSTEGVSLLYQKMPQLSTTPSVFLVEPTIRDVQHAFAANNIDTNMIWSSATPNDLFSLNIDDTYIPDYASLLVNP